VRRLARGRYHRFQLRVSLPHITRAQLHDP
jgi:hypothetical protein